MEIEDIIVIGCNDQTNYCKYQLPLEVKN